MALKQLDNGSNNILMSISSNATKYTGHGQLQKCRQFREYNINVNCFLQNPIQ